MLAIGLTVYAVYICGHPQAFARCLSEMTLI